MPLKRRPGLNGWYLTVKTRQEKGGAGCTNVRHQKRGSVRSSPLLEGGYVR